MVKQLNDWLMAGITLAGAYGQAPNPYSETSPASITTYGDLASCYHRLAEGGRVIDKSVCDSHDIYQGVFRGPMLSMSLPADTVSRLFKPDQTREQVGGLDGLDGLDTVSWDIYSDYWTARGARIGQRVGDLIVWADGVEETIVTPVARA